MRLTRTPVLFTALGLLLGLLTVGSLPASAAVKSMEPTKIKGGTVVFNVKGLRSSKVRSAKLKLGRKQSRISAPTVRRAARKGTLRVRVPGAWRKALRRRGTVRIAGTKRKPRLVVSTSTSTETAPTSTTGTGTSDSPSTGTTSGTGGSGQTSTAPPPAPAPAPPVEITGRTFYVSPSGSDSNAGTSPNSSWRTVTRANRASLSPGDGVLFEGGSTFSDDALMPEGSGSSGAPIVFGSYGTGKATLTKGVWFMSKNWLAFTDLAISGAHQGVAGSANGSGSTNIVVQNSSFRNLGIGINAANNSDRNWTLRSNTVDGTGDSGFILQGDGHRAQENTILNTGTDPSIPYGKHGIYLKSANSRVVGNTIRYFQAEGVSSRYRNAVIEENTISDGEIAIAWYQSDSQSGTSYWHNNTVARTTAACLYVSRSDAAGSTRESFVVSNNKLSKLGGRYTDFGATSGSYSVFDNAES